MVNTHLILESILGQSSLWNCHHACIINEDMKWLCSKVSFNIVSKRFDWGFVCKIKLEGNSFSFSKLIEFINDFSIFLHVPRSNNNISSKLYKFSGSLPTDSSGGASDEHISTTKISGCVAPPSSKICSQCIDWSDG